MGHVWCPERNKRERLRIVEVSVPSFRLRTLPLEIGYNSVNAATEHCVGPYCTRKATSHVMACFGRVQTRAGPTACIRPLKMTPF